MRIMGTSLIEKWRFLGNFHVDNEDHFLLAVRRLGNVKFYQFSRTLDDAGANQGDENS